MAASLPALTFPSVRNVIPQPFHGPLRRLLVRALALLPLPKHVAFIMDGNRRKARQEGVEVIKGHEKGFEALKTLLEFLLALEIPNVTVYAFAIDNFNRPSEEVDGLLELARVKLLELSDKGNILDHYGVRINVVGRKDLLPDNLQRAIEHTEQATMNNKRGTLNVCCAYSSRDELTHAVRSAVDKVDHGMLDRSDINAKTLEESLYTSPNALHGWSLPDPDILVRTSGVSRLSDFLLWQVSEKTSLSFIPRLWPEIGVADLLPVLLGWQAEETWRRLKVDYIKWEKVD
ncbi:Di-trans-poly-cis-decaprenylcistransferase [Cystobasidium minutum MCA 4210]|uniref:Di-trans-poly-cis-decaprenylcistransferase n=1 Tax=Cystobasidium minutum MCA 4210 TaxID=1397322 RepID=UPI0034CE4B85|eukprot:jgi/Rhomi1/186604/estExt_fgenesh1_pm.C_80036